MSRLILLVAVLLVLPLKIVQSKNVYIPSEAQEIIHFCQNNGKDFLAVTTKDLDDSKVLSVVNEIMDLSKHHHNIYSRKTTESILVVDHWVGVPGNPFYTGNDAHTKKKVHFHKDTLVIIASSTTSDNWKEYLNMLSETKVQRGILLFAEPMTTEMINTLNSLLNEHNSNTFFYLVYNEASVDNNDKMAMSNGPFYMNWFQVLVIKDYSQYVSNKLMFNMMGQIIEYYDMQGIEILSIDFEFPPYIVTGQECIDKVTDPECLAVSTKDHPPRTRKCKQCEHSGIIPDAMKVIGNLLNFTTKHHAHPISDLGTAPVEFPANASGKWGGLFGEVFGASYQISISYWNNRLDRHEMFDFVPIVADGLVLAMYPQPPEYDVGLFVRPYRQESWLMVGFAVLVLLVFYYLPQIVSPYIRKQSDNFISLRLVHSCGWYFMMLLEIYYSGALTMFFSTEVGVPFDTMRQVMQAYPDWKLQLQLGMQVFFIYQVEEGDPDYVKFWDRVTDEDLKEETVFEKWDEGIRRMREDFGVILFEEGRLKGYMKNNPEAQQGLAVFDKSKKEFYNMIVTNNSPLGPVLKFGNQLVLEKGVVNYIYKKYLGGELGGGSAGLEQDSMVLSAKQLVLIFFIVLSALGFVLFLFVLESMWRGIGVETLHLDDKASSAVDKMVEEAGRRKSSMMRRGSVMVDGLKEKAAWGIVNDDTL